MPSPATPQRLFARTPRLRSGLTALLLLAAGGVTRPGLAADGAATPTPTSAPAKATGPAPALAPTAPIDLPFEQLPDYWLALPTTVSLPATPLPCQAGALTTRYTIGTDGAITDPTVVAATLDAPHQAEAVAWITQSRFAAAPANAGHRAVRVSQQTNVSCG